MEGILIQKVREHPLLYDSRTGQYRDMDARQKIWQKIGNELNMMADEAKFMWDKLRRCFINARNRRHVKESESGITIYPWKYEKSMSFLWPFVIRNRKTRGIVKPEKITTYDNGHSDPEDCENSGDLKFESNHISDVEEHIKVESGDLTVCNSPITSVASYEHDDNPAIVLAMDSSAASVNNKRDYPVENDNVPDEIGGAKKRYPMPDNSVLDMDECDMFFMSMSKMTKSLSALEQAKVKLAVSNAVLQAVISMHAEANKLPGNNQF